MKNQFKKSDANGNILPEAIGQGINDDHLNKVKAALKKDHSIRFMLTKKEKENFTNAAKGESINESEILRRMIKGYIAGKIKIR